MSYDANTLFGLLPAIHRIRDAELAASMGSHLTPPEVAELVALEALVGPTPTQVARRNELLAKAGKQLSLAELDELRGLDALPSPTIEQQVRIQALHEKAAREPVRYPGEEKWTISESRTRTLVVNPCRLKRPRDTGRVAKTACIGGR